MSFEGDLTEFIRGWSAGEMPFGRWTDHLKVWCEERKPQVLYLTYEGMKEDLSAAVHAIAQHLELSLSTQQLEELVPLFTMSAMKANKASFEPVSVQWKPGFEFLRKGVVGDSKEAFGEECKAIFSQMVSEAWPESVPEYAQQCL